MCDEEKVSKRCSQQSREFATVMTAQVVQRSIHARWCYNPAGRMRLCELLSSTCKAINTLQAAYAYEVADALQRLFVGVFMEAHKGLMKVRLLTSLLGDNPFGCRQSVGVEACTNTLCIRSYGATALILQVPLIRHVLSIVFAALSLLVYHLQHALGYRTSRNFALTAGRAKAPLLPS